MSIKAVIMSIGFWVFCQTGSAQSLLSVRRVFVERLSGGDAAENIRGMVIASLYRTGQFELTEDENQADAVLRGSADDVLFVDVSMESNRTNAGRIDTAGSGSGVTRLTNSNRDNLSTSRSTRESERKHEASASVRLVNHAGDVIWSTTQESAGAKFHSSSAEVADRIAKQLVVDIEKLKRSAAGNLKSVNPNPFPR